MRRQTKSIIAALALVLLGALGAALASAAGDGLPVAGAATPSASMPPPGVPPNPYAGSVLYRGGGDGIKVAFRLRHRRLILASAFVRLNCFGPRGRRHYGRRNLNFAGAGYPLALDARDRFRFAPLADEEESLTIEESLVGRVEPGQIVGSFSYYENLDYRNRRCTTGTHPFRTGGLEFHARRR